MPIPQQAPAGPAPADDMIVTAAIPDRFIAIDWSGAKGRRYAGIAVAECGSGVAPPRLAAPPGGPLDGATLDGPIHGWWSRTAVVAWLVATLARAPALVGIDCAFSLPFAAAGRWLDGPGATAFDLWDLVERATAARGDLLGSPFAEDPAHAPAFWSAGARPPGYAEPHRATELRCRALGLGAPESPFKLIGAKQVGRGALAGMRALRALRAALGDRMRVWPFEDPAPGRSVFVEIYPRLFLRRAGFGNAKIRAPGDVDAALAALGSAPAGLQAPVTDHQADALVSAAGLRRLSADPAVWAPPALDADARFREGWIFGVG